MQKIIIRSKKESKDSGCSLRGVAFLELKKGGCLEPMDTVEMGKRYCVIDTERIKGNQIYLLAYQLYDETFELVESKTFQDISIDLSTRHAPKSKVKELNMQSIKVHSFAELYGNISDSMDGTEVIVFSCTDMKTMKRNCIENGIEFKKIIAIDLQKALYDLATDDKKKSNLKGYCRANGIKYEPHIPESDCYATFILYQNLLSRYGEAFIEKYKVII